MKNIFLGLIAIIAFLLFALVIMWKQVKYADDRWEKAEANVKEYVSLFDYTRRSMFSQFSRQNSVS